MLAAAADTWPRPRGPERPYGSTWSWSSASGYCIPMDRLLQELLVLPMGVCSEEKCKRVCVNNDNALEGRFLALE